MIVYHASKKGFIKDVFNGNIADEIDHAFVTYNPQIEMFAHFKTKSSFHKTKGII